MPRDSSTYIHRVGRTARAGAGGRSVTLVSDARRKVVKDMLKMDAALLSQNNPENTNKMPENSLKGRILSRTVPSTIIHDYMTKISVLEPSIVELMLQEQIENQMRNAVQEIEKTENLMKYSDEIHARPARTWYQTETQKLQKKDLLRQMAQDESSRIAKLSSEDEEHEQEAKLTPQELLLKKKNAIQLADDYREEKGKCPEILGIDHISH